MKTKVFLFFCCLLSSLVIAQESSSSKTRKFLPDYGPVVKNGLDLSLDVSYIYWRVSEDGLTASSGGYNLTDRSSFNTIEPQGEQQGIMDRCSSGFKVGFGMDFKYDDWFMDVVYTYFHSNYDSLKNCIKDCKTNTCEEVKGQYYTTTSGAFQTQASVLPLSQPLFFNNIASFTNSLWTLRFNTIDLMLNKSFYLSPLLVVTPSLGVKTTWQNQSYTVRYLIEGKGVDLGGETLLKYPEPATYFTLDNFAYDPTLENYHIYNKQFYYGVGTRAGFDTAWFLSEELSVFAQIYGTTLFGVFKDRREDTTNVFALDTGDAIIENTTKVNVRAVEHFINGVLETQIGLRWDYYLYQEAYRLRLQFGYENQLWFNQNHFLTPGFQGVSGADLGFMGFNFTVKFDF